MIYTISEKRNVLEASKDRIITIFKTAPKIILSVSGGKDSIVLNDIVYNLCTQGLIDKSKLEVWFVDEEAMYDDVIQNVKMQRLKWLSMGVKFKWYCFQNRHYNCLNTLKEDESFICWDKEIPNKWVRNRPNFSINEDDCLDDKHENYQSWCTKKLIQIGGVCMTGVRVAESLQRFSTFASKKKISCNNRYIWPIYDWTDNDIWYYIKENNLDFPKTYVELWQVGVPKNKLRISQFFALDTVQSLSRLVYIKPDLYEKILKREPNAYLLLLYSGTDMFGGKDSKVLSDKQKKMLKDDNNVDFKRECIDILFRNNPKNKSVVYDKKVWKILKSIIVKKPDLNRKGWKQMYYILLLGDHKLRKTRALYSSFKEN